MSRISRREVVRGTAVTAATVTLGAPLILAQTSQQTLRFVAQADLKILDHVWSTAYITRKHGYLVYDTLFGTDEGQQIKPRMVERTTVSSDGMTYTFTLRDGLRWHDGQSVLSEDCVESLSFKVILKAMDWSTNLVVRFSCNLARMDHTCPDRNGGFG